jgi:hypothetical protein
MVQLGSEGVKSEPGAAVRNAAEIHCVYRANSRKRARCGPQRKPGKPVGPAQTKQTGRGAHWGVKGTGPKGPGPAVAEGKRI